MSLRTVQLKLQAAGFDPGPIDGLWGRRTEAALDAALEAASAEKADAARELALERIKRWESIRLTAYPDPGTGGDPWTIGWGSTGPDVRRGTVWTQEQADARLARDVQKFLDGVRAAVTAPAAPHEIAAMTSLAYNIGLGAFRNSTLLRMFNAGNKTGAADQFGRWIHAGGEAMQGLINRRDDERKLFEGRG